MSCNNNWQPEKEGHLSCNRFIVCPGQAAREPKLGEIDLQGNNWKSDDKIGIFKTYIKNETGYRVWRCPLRFWSKMMLAGVR